MCVCSQLTSFGASSRSSGDHLRWCFQHLCHLYVTCLNPLAGIGIAPALAGGFAAVTYLLVKLMVLIHKDPVRMALFTAPFWFFTVTAILTLSISASSQVNLTLWSLTLSPSFQGSAKSWPR